MNTSTNESAGHHYLAELQNFLAHAAGVMRARREFHPLAMVNTAAQIAADALHVNRKLAQAGHRSECYDLEAEVLLREFIAAHGHLPAGDKAQLEKAVRLVHQSAEADHDIVEYAGACAA